MRLTLWAAAVVAAMPVAARADCADCGRIAGLEAPAGAASPTLAAMEDDLTEVERQILLRLGLEPEAAVARIEGGVVLRRLSGDLDIVHWGPADAPLLHFAPQPDGRYAYPSAVLQALGAAAGPPRRGRPVTVRHFSAAQAEEPQHRPPEPLLTGRLQPDGEAYAPDAFGPFDLPQADPTATEILDWQARLAAADARLAALRRVQPDAAARHAIEDEVRAQGRYVALPDAFWAPLVEARRQRGAPRELEKRLVIRDYLNGRFIARDPVSRSFELSLFAYMFAMNDRCRDVIERPVPLTIEMANEQRDPSTGVVTRTPAGEETLLAAASLARLYQGNYESFFRIAKELGVEASSAGIRSAFDGSHAGSGEAWAIAMAPREEIDFLIDAFGCDATLLAQLGENIRRYGEKRPPVQSDPRADAPATFVYSYVHEEPIGSTYEMVFDRLPGGTIDAHDLEAQVRAVLGTDIVTTSGRPAPLNLVIRGAAPARRGLATAQVLRLANDATWESPLELEARLSAAGPPLRSDAAAYAFVTEAGPRASLLRCRRTDGTISETWMDLASWYAGAGSIAPSGTAIPAGHPITQIPVGDGTCS